MTNFEKITESPEMLARVLTAFAQEVEMKFLKRAEENGIMCGMYSLPDELQIQIHLDWLLKEWTNEADTGDE